MQSDSLDQPKDNGKYSSACHSSCQSQVHNVSFKGASACRPRGAKITRRKPLTKHNKLASRTALSNPRPPHHQEKTFYFQQQYSINKWRRCTFQSHLEVIRGATTFKWLARTRCLFNNNKYWRGLAVVGRQTFVKVHRRRPNIIDTYVQTGSQYLPNEWFTSQGTLPRLLCKDQTHTRPSSWYQKKLLFCPQSWHHYTNWWIPTDTPCLLLDNTTEYNCDVTASHFRIDNPSHWQDYHDS